MTLVSDNIPANDEVWAWLEKGIGVESVIDAWIAIARKEVARIADMAGFVNEASTNEMTVAVVSVVVNEPDELQARVKCWSLDC